MQMNISVITVCYNAEQYIEETMLSVLRQTYSNIEYIIVDGASQDKTLQCVEKVKNLFPHRTIRVISGPDKGIYDAMNKGIGVATGEWINMMNAGDTFSSPDILQKIADSGLMGRYSFVYSDFVAKNGMKKKRIVQSYDSGKILHQSSIYKRDLHEKYGLYYVTHPYIVSDYLFFLQVPKDEFAKFNEPISVNDVSGISMQGYWMEYGRISADYMMRRTSEGTFVRSVIVRYWKNRIKELLRHLL